MSGLYIHIPFCASRCIYCGFYSTTLPQLQGDYVAALSREMELRHDFLPEEDRRVATIYIGGGTPSRLGAAQLSALVEAIRRNYDVSPDAEFTMECNPDDITENYATTLHQLGVNRVSMGAQTFSDERLRFLHRRHTAKEVSTAVGLLRKAGIENVSLDLMFGFPGETLDDWQADIEQCLALKPNHISAYSLMYEEGTPLMKLLEEKKIEEIDDELSRRMFFLCDETLCTAGYEHYEISNYARPGYRSRHNSSYWNDTPYIGLGAAAHSYNYRVRQWNVADIRKYIAAIKSGEIPAEGEKIRPWTHYNDLITTALRTADGLDLNLLEIRFRNYLLTQATPFLDRGEMKLKGDHLSIAKEALYISDDIMSELMKV